MSAVFEFQVELLRLLGVPNPEKTTGDASISLQMDGLIRVHVERYLFPASGDLAELQRLSEKYEVRPRKRTAKANPFSILQEFDDWFAWEVDRTTPKSPLQIAMEHGFELAPIRTVEAYDSYH